MHRRIQPVDVYEPVKGLYSQVVEVAPGPRVEIAGTLPYESDGALARDLLSQSGEMVANLDRSLRAADLDPSDVVRIRVYTTQMDQFLRGGSMQVVFGYFGDNRPVSTLVEVSRLANSEVFVEMDAECVRQERGEA